MKRPSTRKRPSAKKPVAPAAEKYILRLFVAGASVLSHQALLRVRSLCETSLKGRVKLEVIDIYQQPGLARDNQIVATPTLLVVLPRPIRRFIGSLTTISDIFSLLDLGEEGRILL